MKKEDCPLRALHTPEPEGYIQWHAWAREMGRTHDQRRCDGCGLYAIWVRRAGEAGQPHHDGRMRCSRALIQFTYTDHLGNTWCQNCERIVAFAELVAS
jgi:hypothetical protein